MRNPEAVVPAVAPNTDAASTTVTAEDVSDAAALIAEIASTTVTALAVVPAVALIVLLASTTVTALEVTPALAPMVAEPCITRMPELWTCDVAARVDAPSCNVAVENAACP